LPDDTDSPEPSPADLRRRLPALYRTYRQAFAGALPVTREFDAVKARVAGFLDRIRNRRNA
jgi:hypothetical protein